MSNKTSDKNVANIEDDVNELKSIMNLRTESGFAYSQKNTLKLQKSIRNVLAEREQDKKRIQELEEENYVRKIQIYEKSIAKEKVIEAFEDIEDYFDRLNGPDEDMDYIRQVKQELLEGEK